MLLLFILYFSAHISFAMVYKSDVQRAPLFRFLSAYYKFDVTLIRGTFCRLEKVIEVRKGGKVEGTTLNAHMVIIIIKYQWNNICLRRFSKKYFK